jgi:hypothetical protein
MWPATEYRRRSVAVENENQGQEMNQHDEPKPMRSTITVGEVLEMIDRRIAAAQTEWKMLLGAKGEIPDGERRVRSVKCLGEVEGLKWLRLEIAFPDLFTGMPDDPKTRRPAIDGDGILERMVAETEN